MSADTGVVRRIVEAVLREVRELLPCVISGVQDQIANHPGTPATPTSRGSITLAGDLGGTSSSPTVVGVQGTAVSATAPTAGQAWVSDGTQMVPVDVATQAELEAAAPPIATANAVGTVKPDGTTTTVDGAGTLTTVRTTYYLEPLVDSTGALLLDENTDLIVAEEAWT